LLFVAIRYFLLWFLAVNITRQLFSALLTFSVVS